MMWRLVAVFAVIANGALAMAESVEFHGSGTTNPSKYFWKVLEMLEEQSRTPLLGSYRAVGSGTGQFEFVGETNPAGAYEPYSHFGAGDIPMGQSYFDGLDAAGKEMIHVPFILGAISFFHSVPSETLGTGGQLNLDPCTLAKIFQREITTWDHADIIALNPGLSVPQGQEIHVVRRVYGSSSTSLSSQYLDGACPGGWTIGVGKGNADSTDPSTPTAAPFWPSGTVPAQGSDGVSTYISSTPYSIGYLDAGHGHKDNLAEIELENADGVFLSSKEADIGAAALQLTLPAYDASWADVSLLNLPGATTWPITTFSYMYIRRDLSAFNQTAAAVKAFAQFILSDAGQSLVTDFAFDPLPASVQASATAALETLDIGTATPYTFETASSTQKGVGMGEYVISGKRRDYGEYERGVLMGQIEDLTAMVAELQAEVSSLASPSGSGAEDYETAEDYEAPTEDYEAPGAEDYETADLEDYEDGGSDAPKPMDVAAAALVFALLGLLLGIISLSLVCVTRRSMASGSGAHAKMVETTQV
eukprot:CAMPEP_0170161838 /NCGR_PEP_ID=MMETSP0033_2-20121228/76795_1 /TAXON_ID=195969 /ORGANISM="Dolichomastix tenuilepis, Strain CCMP3274" /LENGTH=532 /DNA_ID=CAMNT_0010399461 /DNA_START=423 /DNA_END=2021 /DNA_ORIENTATION=-